MIPSPLWKAVNKNVLSTKFVLVRGLSRHLWALNRSTFCALTFALCLPQVRAIFSGWDTEQELSRELKKNILGGEGQRSKKKVTNQKSLPINQKHFSEKSKIPPRYLYSPDFSSPNIIHIIHIHIHIWLKFGHQKLFYSVIIKTKNNIQICKHE